jgi:hypothetical protein
MKYLSAVDSIVPASVRITGPTISDYKRLKWKERLAWNPRRRSINGYQANTLSGPGVDRSDNQVDGTASQQTRPASRPDAPKKGVLRPEARAQQRAGGRTGKKGHGRHGSGMTPEPRGRQQSAGIWSGGTFRLGGDGGDFAKGCRFTTS